MNFLAEELFTDAGYAKQVELKIGIKALLYNTTEAYHQCNIAEGQCNVNLFFLSDNAALLTSPGQISVSLLGRSPFLVTNILAIYITQKYRLAPLLITTMFPRSQNVLFICL